MLERSIPDWSDWDAADAWVREGLGQLACLPRSCGDEGRFESTVAPAAGGGPFGSFADPSWRRSVLATFLADLACYPSAADQVSLARLSFAMDVFPQGFRTWWVRDEQGRPWPAGYAAWHPMSAATFSILAREPATLRDRAIAPLHLQDHPFVYVFNYSVVPCLRKSALSRTLVKALAADMAGVQPAGLAALAVSEDGCRIAERFGMNRTGALRSGEYAFTTEPRPTEPRA